MEGKWTIATSGRSHSIAWSFASVTTLSIPYNVDSTSSRHCICHSLTTTAATCAPLRRTPALYALLSRLEPSVSTYADTQALQYKDVATNAQAIKAKIRKATAALSKVGDIDRTVEEQEEEIRELEERIRKQKEVLRRLSRMAERVEGRVVGGG
ncbi:hypothetical protein H2203_005633 [Taxawa tesnikishii (nom. ined.)]|nr:hypothetical protein H2203_005633 [Dothideales sp. JES 119]